MIGNEVNPRPGGSFGAENLGFHIEGPFISQEKKGAHNDKLIRNFDKVIEKYAINKRLDLFIFVSFQGVESIELVYGPHWKNIALVTLAPELDNSTQVIQHLTSHGVIVSLGHSIANLTQGEQAVRNGASCVTHLFNAMPPVRFFSFTVDAKILINFQKQFHHREPGLVGLLGSGNIPTGRTVYYGVIADGIHTHSAAIRIAYRAHPDGIVLVTDAMFALGLPPGLYKGIVEVREDCAVLVGTETLCGAVASMDKCVRNFKQATGRAN